MRIYRRKTIMFALLLLWRAVCVCAQEEGGALLQRDTAGLPQVRKSEDEEVVPRTALEGMAADAFRLGVAAYYRGAFSDAAILFEKSLSYKSDDNLILDWLAKSYYRAGQESEALAAWQGVLSNGYRGQGIAIGKEGGEEVNLTLQGKIETIRNRRLTGLARQALSNQEYTQSGSYQGVALGSIKEGKGENPVAALFHKFFPPKDAEQATSVGVAVFRSPTGLVALPDGTLWLSAYDSNELLHINVNGNVFDRVTGPLGGLARPLDLIMLGNGNLLASESAGDCLAVFDAKGKFLRRIASRGRAVGQLLGPQYLATDDALNIYVSDYGNRRISVFDSEGNGLFAFGTVKYDKDVADGELREFNGLKGPTGVAVLGTGSDTRIFVADDVTGGVYEFDRAGNFRRVLVQEGTFKRPESLKVWSAADETAIDTSRGDGVVPVLLVCDTNRILSIDPDTGEVIERARLGSAPARATSAVCDANCNMLVADMQGQEVAVLSDMSEVVGSLFIQVERVHSQNFPTVTLEVKVEDRHRRAIVGLGAENFYITENGSPVLDQALTGAANNNTACDIAIVIDRSDAMSDYSDAVNQAVHEIAAGMSNMGGTLHIICAGAKPTEEYNGPAAVMQSFQASAIRTPLTARVPMDSALRLASNTLINGEKKRGIVLVTQGSSVHTFDAYTLSQISAFLNNNSISLSVVNVEQSAPTSEVDYLTRSTEGSEYYVFRPAGLAGVSADIAAIPNGLYEITYTSVQPSNLGESYMRVEAETSLLGRSGRDESGYFAPLQ